MKMPAHAAQSESKSDDEDRGTSFQDNRRTFTLTVNQATFLCCRQDAGKYEYLIVDDAKVYHKGFPRFMGVSFDDEDEDFTRMHEQGPKEPYRPFKLNEHCKWLNTPEPHYLC